MVQLKPTNQPSTTLKSKHKPLTMTCKALLIPADLYGFTPRCPPTQSLLAYFSLDTTCSSLNMPNILWPKDLCSACSQLWPTLLSILSCFLLPHFIHVSAQMSPPYVVFPDHPSKLASLDPVKGPPFYAMCSTY